MSDHIVLIFQSIQNLHELEDELNKPFGWIRLFTKWQCGKLRKQIRYKIDQLINDQWSIKYLFNLQTILRTYYDKINMYLGQDMYLSDELLKSPYGKFCPMYFVDRDKPDHLIIIEILLNNINFRVVNTSTGNLFSLESHDIQPSQYKVISVCKRSLINTLIRYLNRQI